MDLDETYTLPHFTYIIAASSGRTYVSNNFLPDQKDASTGSSSVRFNLRGTWPRQPIQAMILALVNMIIDSVILFLATSLIKKFGKHVDWIPLLVTMMMKRTALFRKDCLYLLSCRGTILECPPFLKVFVSPSIRKVVPRGSTRKTSTS